MPSQDGGIIGSKSIFLPESIKNRDVDSDYLAEIYKNNPEIFGSGFDIHKLIGKLPRPKKGFTLPGYNYAGPYNPLDKQLRFDPTTGEILEIYQKPTGKTDAVAMQHDVDYSLCGDNKKCKNEADRKMVERLDSIPGLKDNGGTLVSEVRLLRNKSWGLGQSQKTAKGVE